MSLSGFKFNMKISLVFLGLVVVFGTATPVESGNRNDLEAELYQQRAFEGSINKTINDYVATLIPYDPLDVEHQEISFLGYTAEVTKAHLDGFSNIFASKIKFSGFTWNWTLKLTINIPLITGYIENWKADGDLFYGNGAASLEIKDTKLQVNAKINVLTQNVKSLNLTPSIGDAKVSITGIYNDPELSQKVSDYINYILNDVVNNNKELHKKLSDFVLKQIQ